MLGDYLKTLRTSRRLSTDSLATKAGIARNTISRWENGLNLPHIPELEALMGAIQATRHERQRALELLPAARGTKALKAANTETHQLPAGWGEVLWALRLRNGWTLEQLAASLNIKGDANIAANVFRHRYVGHGPRVFDERLDPTERFGECEEAQASQCTKDVTLSTLQAEGKCSSEARCLPERQVVLRMCLQSGMEDFSDTRMRLEPPGQPQRVLVVRLHSESQGLDAAENQEAVLRTGAGAHRVLEEADFVSERGIVYDRGSAHHIGMAVDVLCRRVNDNIDAVLKWPLEEG